AERRGELEVVRARSSTADGNAAWRVSFDCRWMTSRGDASAKRIQSARRRTRILEAAPLRTPQRLTDITAAVGPPHSHAPCDGRVTNSGRSPGSRVVASVHLPGRRSASSGFLDEARRLQLRGQPRNWPRRSRTAFPWLGLSAAPPESPPSNRPAVRGSTASEYRIVGNSPNKCQPNFCPINISHDKISVIS